MKGIVMQKTPRILPLLMSLCVGVTLSASAQDASKVWQRQGPYRILDTPEIKAKVEAARALAGSDKYLRITQRLQCRDVDSDGVIGGPPGSNMSGGAGDRFAADGIVPAGPGIEPGREVPAIPTKVFDNVYYVGGKEVGGWLIDTGDGYIMLDSSYDYGVESILLPGMKTLGLDPAKVKYILITHGSGPVGGDHSGGVKYFNEHYGTKVVLSAPEWVRTQQNVARMGMPWVKDGDVVVGTEGMKLTLGNTTVTVVNTPRNVGGGGLSYFIPVKVNGKPHMWMTYGNTNVTGKLPDKLLYRESVANFLKYVDALKADIVISSHPFVDGSLMRMEQIRNSKPGARNPFVIGQRDARRYIEILDACAVVHIAREEAGLDGTGTMRLADMPKPRF